MVLQKERDQLFVAGVGVVLAGEDRYGPPALAVHDRLVVPVGALDQADAHRRPAGLGPGEQVPDVACGVLEVRLQREAGEGIGAKLVFHQELADDPDRQVLPLVVLHVEGDGGPTLHGRSE